ncbi:MULTISPECIES: cell division protein SepF [Bacillaceae]|jgi:cell division inhibitor SepF|uniref:cell division protein SepF n=1 Tax=Bacillaceae TaxID=186817 RepID=UPI00101BF88D|nr:cell division protein SepF [Ectobacillus funiculus]
MSWTKVKDFFFDTPEEQEARILYEGERERSMDEDIQLPKAPQKQNVVSIEKAKQGAKVVLLEPRTYAEAQAIADHLKGRRAVVMNLQRMPTDQALRMVDFMSGTVYAIGGDIQKLGVRTFLCTPDNVDILGSISELLGESEESNNKRW